MDDLDDLEQTMLEWFADVVYRFEMSGGTDEEAAAAIDAFMEFRPRWEGEQ